MSFSEKVEAEGELDTAKAAASPAQAVSQDPRARLYETIGDARDEDLFNEGENSEYKFESERAAEGEAWGLWEKVGKVHHLQLKKVVEEWIRKHTKASNISPRAGRVLKTALLVYFEEAKVYTKLTQYGTRFLLILMGGENVCENISDIVNLVNLYNRGELVFFGLSLGCTVSLTCV